MYPLLSKILLVLQQCILAILEISIWFEGIQIFVLKRGVLRKLVVYRITVRAEKTWSGFEIFTLRTVNRRRDRIRFTAVYHFENANLEL